MIVKELIQKLEEYPEDMLVAIDGDIYRDKVTRLPSSKITLKKATWINSNYPYTEEEFEFINLE